MVRGPCGPGLGCRDHAVCRDHQHGEASAWLGVTVGRAWDASIPGLTSGGYGYICDTGDVQVLLCSLRWSSCPHPMVVSPNMSRPRMTSIAPNRQTCQCRGTLISCPQCSAGVPTHVLERPGEVGTKTAPLCNGNTKAMVQMVSPILVSSTFPATQEGGRAHYLERQ